MVIKTNPETTEYDLISGVIKYEQDYNNEEIGVNKIQNPDEGEQLNRNPFLKLEVKQLDILKGDELRPVIHDLYEEKVIKC